MKTVRIQAQPRSAAGSRSAEQIRSAGRVPAMLYGGGEANLALSLDTREFLRALKDSTIEFTLDVEGRAVQAALRDLQFDRFGDRLQHVDFQRDPDGAVAAALVEKAKSAEAVRRKMVEAAIAHQAFEEAQRKAAEAAAAAAAAAAASPGSTGAAATPAAPGAAAAAPAAAAPAKEGGKEKPAK